MIYPKTKQLIECLHAKTLSKEIVWKENSDNNLFELKFEINCLKIYTVLMTRNSFSILDENTILDEVVFKYERDMAEINGKMDEMYNFARSNSATLNKMLDDILEHLKSL